jgi:hypothetical protein
MEEGNKNSSHLLINKINDDINPSKQFNFNSSLESKCNSFMYL